MDERAGRLLKGTLSGKARRRLERPDLYKLIEKGYSYGQAQRYLDMRQQKDQEEKEGLTNRIKEEAERPYIKIRPTPTIPEPEKRRTA